MGIEAVAMMAVLLCKQLQYIDQLHLRPLSERGQDSDVAELDWLDYQDRSSEEIHEPVA